MALSRPFQTQNVPLINYDFVDAATGVSYIAFYGLNGDLDGDEQMKLITATPNSTGGTGVYDAGKNIHYGVTTRIQSQTSEYPNLHNYTPVAGTIEYSTAFKVPMTLSGAAIFSFSHGLGSTGACPDGRIKTILDIQKNGVHIVSGATQVTSLGAVGNGTSTAESVVIDIPTTHFAPGDTLEIDIDAWGGGSGANQVYWGIGMDPGNRNDPWPDGSGKTIEDTDNTQFIAYLPVRIDQ